jgi:soluble lytic murein transglycosylase
MKLPYLHIKKHLNHLLVAVFSIFAVLTILVGCTAPLLSDDAATPSQPAAEITPTEITPDPITAETPTPAIRMDEAFRSLFSGDYASAITLYQTALDQAQDAETQAAALLGMGRAYFDAGECNTALTSFQLVTSQFNSTSSTAPAYFFIAQCQEALEQYAQAAASYGAYLSLRPGILDGEILTLQGNVFSQAGEHASSLQSWQAALQASPPGDYDNLNLLIGRYYSAMGDYETAVRLYLDLYNTTSNGETRATANYLAGQAYLSMGYPEQAYARFQDSITNYYRYADSYYGLVQLVNDGVAVNELYRGLVDYYAGLYGIAIDAFQRYLDSTPEHDATAHLFMGYSYMYLGQAEDAIAAYDAIITDHQGDPLWVTAWDEKAWIQWTMLDQYAQGAQTLLGYVALIPDAAEAADFLFETGRIYEAGNLLNEASITWERLINEYPSAEPTYQALFLAWSIR